MQAPYIFQKTSSSQSNLKATTVKKDYTSITTLTDLLKQPSAFCAVSPPATGMPYLDYWSCIIWADSRSPETDEYYTRVVYASPANANELWKLNVTNATQFSWIKLAPATPPQEFDLPLAEEMQPLPAYGSNKYWKNQFNEVTLTLSVTKTDMNTNDIPNGAFLATLPAGFRPLTPVSGAAYVDRGEDDNVYPGFIIINPDGSVRLFQAKQVPCSMVIASTSFVAAT